MKEANKKLIKGEKYLFQKKKNRISYMYVYLQKNYEMFK